MLRTVQRTIERHRLFRRGDHILVAVSGGADSVALAYALHYLKKRYRLSLTLVHLHHGIRGRAADEDARFVNELAWRLGLPCVQARVDVPRRARQAKLSLEMAARELRYDFFVRAAHAAGAGCVATAHTADDQAETILLKLARGAGPQGLSGIPHVTERHGLRIVRPLLDVTHPEVVRFLRRYGLKWREDESNLDPGFLRNRARHEILPLLESRLNPQVRRALLRTSELIREENEWLDTLARGLLGKCLERKRPAVLRVDPLKRLRLAARRRVIRLWLISREVDPECVDFDAVEGIERLLREPRGTRSVSLGGGRSVVRRYRALSLEQTAGAEEPSFCAPLVVPGETILPEQRLRVVTRWDRGVLRQTGAKVGELPAEASLGARAARRARLRVRSWQPGDPIRPLGLGGSKKLQDLFVDQKIPRDRRSQVPVLESRGEVVWLPGYRIARGWEVKDPSGPALHVFVRRI
ncbi:MAG: tRNA lysidine(34) synthetase TilS [Verrucomicrobiota bacterium]